MSWQGCCCRHKPAKTAVQCHVAQHPPPCTHRAAGAGKSSLLAALSGKAAAYGVVTGTTLVNGRPDRLERYKSLMGFVPQVRGVVGRHQAVWWVYTCCHQVIPLPEGMHGHPSLNKSFPSRKRQAALPLPFLLPPSILPPG